MVGNEERFWDDSVRFHALSWDLKSDPAQKKLLSWHLCASISFHENLQKKTPADVIFLGQSLCIKCMNLSKKRRRGQRMFLISFTLPLSEGSFFTAASNNSDHLCSNEAIYQHPDGLKLLIRN